MKFGEWLAPLTEHNPGEFWNIKRLLRNERTLWVTSMKGCEETGTLKETDNVTIDFENNNCKFAKACLCITDFPTITFNLSFYSGMLHLPS